MIDITWIILKLRTSSKDSIKRAKMEATELKLFVTHKTDKWFIARICQKKKKKPDKSVSTGHQKGEWGNCLHRNFIKKKKANKSMKKCSILLVIREMKNIIKYNYIVNRMTKI